MKGREMAEKHTPDVWRVEWDGDAVWSGKYPICNLATPRDSSMQTKLARANLIAAAPNLLTELEGLKQLVSAIQDGDEPYQAIDNYDIDRARTIIAKAIGMASFAKAKGQEK